MSTEIVYHSGRLKDLLAPLRPVYVLYGEEDTQKDEIIGHLRDAAIDPAFADFDAEELDASTFGVENILASAAGAPFGSPCRFVVVRRAEVFRKRDRAAETERLAQAITALPAATVLVLRVGAPEESWGRARTALSAKIDAAVREKGVIVQCRPLSSEALTDWLHAEAAKSGKRVDARAAERLVEVAQGERLPLRNELEKVVCYAGDAPRITVEMVDSTCSHNPEDVMFKLIDAISIRNLDRALGLFHEILQYDAKPQSVAGRFLALLARQVRLLTQAHELAALGMQPHSLKTLPQVITDQLPAEGSILAMSWKARDLFGQARHWTRQDLCRAFDLLVECDVANKGGGEGSANVVTNLELLIISLCRPHTK